MGNWLWEGGFMAREGWWWSSSVLVSKSSRASRPVLLWCLRAEFGLAWVSALDGLFIFSGAGRCAMRFLSHSICLRRSNRKEVWVPVLLYGLFKCFAIVLRLEHRSVSKLANTTDFLSFSPEMQMFYSCQTSTFQYNSIVLYCSSILSMYTLFEYVLFVLFSSFPFFSILI